MMGAHGPIRVFLAADRAVFRHIPAVLRSASAVTSRPIEAGIMVQGVGPAARRVLQDKLPAIPLTFFDMDGSEFESLHVKRSLSPMAFARMLMPEMVAWDRLVYLDIDVLVLRDLAVLHDLPMAGSPLAAVPSGSSINSGVLLFDAAAWRARGLGATILDYARTHRPPNADQDSIWAVLGPEIMPLERHWNSEIDMVWEPPIPDTGALMREVSVLHFITGFKPWNPGRLLLPRPLRAAWDFHADAADLPRDWRSELRMLGWQLGILARVWMRR